jgi:thiol-disulfide isomerase/thioredoxin
MHKIYNILLIAAALLTATACKQAHNEFTILGQMPENGFDGAKVYLVELNSNQPVDSAVISGGQFQLSGTVDTVRMMQLVSAVDPSRPFASTIVLEPGQISINLVTDSLSGTPLNDLYFRTYTCDTAAQTLQRRMQATLERYYLAANATEQAAIVKIYTQTDSLLNAHNIAHNQKVFEANKDNIIGAYALSNLVEYEDMSFEKLDSIMSHSSSAIANYGPLLSAHKQLLHVANTSEGKPYVDIEGIDFATGNATTLSAMLDSTQVTLVDFWASWCGPCRQEISENLVRLYKKYGAKGLNIIGVDVWDKLPNHKKAVEDLGITYPQLIDTTRAATENYGVVGIPTILLLDKDGTILKRGLRGDDIEAAIKEALNVR